MNLNGILSNGETEETFKPIPDEEMQNQVSEEMKKLMVEIKKEAQAEELGEIYSPVLRQIPSTQLPKKDMMCMHCRAACWILREEEAGLMCYCISLRSITYSKDVESLVQNCDGKYMADMAAENE